MKKQNVILAMAHPDTGEIFTVGTKNPEWCSIRIETSKIVNNGNGLFVRQTRVAFVRMQVDLAQELVDAKVLANKKEFPLPGRIIVQESLEPFFDGQEAKINPSTGEPVLWAGTMPIYRQAIYVSDESTQDELIADYVAKMERDGAPITGTMVEEKIGSEQIAE